MPQKKKRNIIIGVLCIVLLLMVVGYAAFQSVLKINGTSSISSEWNVQITGIEQTASLGAIDAEAPTYDNTNGLSATFKTNLTSPGDYATYKITITNNGSLDAILKNITMPENTNQDIIFYLNKDQNNQDIEGALKQNDTLTKASGSSNIGYVYVTVLYKDYDKQQTATTKTQEMTITFDFEQTSGDSGTIEPVPTSNAVYSNASNQLKLGDSIEGIETTTDPTTLGKNYYLKHEIDDGNKITESYVCFITDTEHCMKANDVENSKALLQSQQAWFTNNGGSCEDISSSFKCTGGGFTQVRSDYNGTVSAGTAAKSYCQSQYNDIIYCLG